MSFTSWHLRIFAAYWLGLYDAPAYASFQVQISSPQYVLLRIRANSRSPAKRPSRSAGWQRSLAGNVFVERLWRRASKYEEVYCAADGSGGQRRTRSRYLDF